MNGGDDPRETNEITFRDVYYRFGDLESQVKNIRDSQSRLENKQKSFDTKLSNIAEVLSSYKIKKDKIENISEDIDVLKKNQNQFIGGKGAVVLIIILAVSIFSAVAGLWLSYKSDRKMEKIQEKILDNQNRGEKG